MPPRTKFTMGRQRVTRAVAPHESGYIQHMNAQMAGLASIIQEYITQLREHATPEAIEFALTPIYETSQELVPVDTGRLKASGYLRVRKTGKDVVGEVGYGYGGHPHYTQIVHERTDVYHRPPTQAKFLEEAVNRNIDEVIHRIMIVLFVKEGGE